MTLILLLCLLADPYSEEHARAVLESMRKDARRYMSVDPEDGLFFYRLTLQLRAKRVLEIGTSAGYSGGWFAMALKKTGGRLITLEIDPERHAAALKNFAAMGVLDVVDARLANALVEVARIDGPFDIVFIDAWKPDYLRYYELVLPKVRSGGAILAHNTRNAAFTLRPFLERIQNDPAVKTEFLRESPQGLSISWKK
ncbi:MAG: caffeoyl-CoA O-methyltransferase [Bryobacteraceae bacterium]|nr:MAG: caffeoyl-CoA O-methyltransferase [Bryobacteraceae bacterium]